MAEFILFWFTDQRYSPSFGMELTATGTCCGWLHCIHHQEAKSDENWYLDFSFLFGQGPQPMKRGQSTFRVRLPTLNHLSYLS